MHGCEEERVARVLMKGYNNTFTYTLLCLYDYDEFQGKMNRILSSISLNNIVGIKELKENDKLAINLK